MLTVESFRNIMKAPAMYAIKPKQPRSDVIKKVNPASEKSVKKVLEAITKKRGMTRLEIAKKIRLSKVCLTKCLSQLLDLKKIKAVDTEKGAGKYTVYNYYLIDDTSPIAKSAREQIEDAIYSEIKSNKNISRKKLSTRLDMTLYLIDRGLKVLLEKKEITRVMGDGGEQREVFLHSALINK